MEPTELKVYLDSLCTQLDSGGRLRAVRWAGATLVATGAMVGCFERDDLPMVEPVYGAPPMQEICGDGVDNDGDELADCADEDCASDAACEMVDVYGGPPVEEVCGDAIDNDGDSLVDCDDEDCVEDPACAAAEAPAVPPTPDP